MNPTIQQRNQYYKTMYNEIMEGEGFCRLSQRLFGFYPRADGFYLEPIKEEYFSDVLPELYDKKPSVPGYIYWFPLEKEGLEIRKEILKECINETNS